MVYVYVYTYHIDTVKACVGHLSASPHGPHSNRFQIARFSRWSGAKAARWRDWHGESGDGNLS